ncbi:MAG: hypothetical protein NT027_09670 [Proteobacteria bacterium]|nr:hypothetical protein [Pseudomonadota bacterium]
MDFRDRYPNIKFWPAAVADRCYTPFPYRQMFLGRLIEFPAPDDSTSFLVISHFDETDCDSPGRFYCYGVEAPKGYHLRTQFESGLINWTDFMAHRNWLIELTSQLFDQGPCNVRYVSPMDIHPVCKEELLDLDTRGGPLKILHDHLLSNYEAEKTWANKSYVAKEEYFEFLSKFGSMFDLSTTKIA